MKDWETPVEVKCADCGTMFTITRSWYNVKMRTPGSVFRCKQCISKHRTELMIARNAAMTPEEKKKMYDSVSAKKKEYWDNLDPNKKSEYLEKLNNAAAEWRENETDEERERISKIHAEANHNRWVGISDERRKELINNAKKAWERKTDEEKIAWGKVSKDRWDRYSKIIIVNEDKNDEVPLTKKDVIIRDIISKARSKNGLTDTFEKRFIDAGLDSCYTLCREYPLTNNGVTHCWDYAIRDKNSRLICLVDLDGTYYHGDKYDYDGIHSKIEYDLQRRYAIPDNTLYCIIREADFDPDFIWLKRILPLSWDEYVDLETKYLSAMPCPKPRYGDTTLIKSFEMLKKIQSYDDRFSPRQGDRIVHHFYPGLWDEKIWTPDNIRNMLNNHEIYYTHLNPNKILMTLTPEFYSPAETKLAIMESGVKEVYDPDCNPCALLAATSLGLPYITIHIPTEMQNMIDFLTKYGVKCDIRVEEG